MSEEKVYVYERYEMGWWRRYTEKQWEAEKRKRSKQGHGTFETFRTHQNLGEITHLDRQRINEIEIREWEEKVGE